MAKQKNTPSQGFSEMLLYKTANGNVKVEIFIKDETLWLTQQKIADLFGVQRPAITKHLKNIFDSGELQEDVVSSVLEHTTPHGAIEGKMQQSQTKYYNLDAIISVGYRVNSTQATQFRIWATERLKEYIIKGFTMDDEKLKNPNANNHTQKNTHWVNTYQLGCTSPKNRDTSPTTEIHLPKTEIHLLQQRYISQKQR